MKTSAEIYTWPKAVLSHVCDIFYSFFFRKQVGWSFCESWNRTARRYAIGEVWYTANSEFIVKNVTRLEFQ